MPNHFVNVCICRQTYGDPDTDELKDIEQLNGKDLCEIANPAPEVFSNIVSAGSPIRFRHRETGQWHPSVNPPMGEDAGSYEEVPLTPEEIRDLRATYGAVDWYEWNRNNWGTKWGAYGTSTQRLAGDDNFVMITFQTAWGPANNSTMIKIEEYLAREYNLTNFHWVGCDPYDGGVSPIAVEAPAPSHSLEHSIQVIRDVLEVQRQEESVN